MVVAKSHVVIASCRHRFMSSSLHVIVATLQRVTIHWQWIDSISWYYSIANRQKNEQIYKRSPLACWYNGNDTFVIIKNRSRMEDKIAKRMYHSTHRVLSYPIVAIIDVCNGWPACQSSTSQLCGSDSNSRVMWLRWGVRSEWWKKWENSGGGSLGRLQRKAVGIKFTLKFSPIFKKQTM